LEGVVPEKKTAWEHGIFINQPPLGMLKSRTACSKRNIPGIKTNKLKKIKFQIFSVILAMYHVKKGGRLFQKTKTPTPGGHFAF
jgi:hypothetical protein